MALLVTLWKGNPGTLQFISPTGNELLTLKLESAALRREVSSRKGLRFQSVHAVTVPKNISRQGRTLADFLASLYNTEVTESDIPSAAESKGSNKVEIRVEDLGGGKILWTHFHAVNGEEIGPRIRVIGLRK
jgi:rRNA maturation protein Rpf1